jgi:1-deoxy-D-xylulose-5-phosphate synthase
LVHMTATAASICNFPSAIRYPRGEGVGVELPSKGRILEIGKGRIVRQGKTVAILSLGASMVESLKAAENLESRGLSTTIADARFAKPIDHKMIAKLALDHEVLITIEEGSAGGFSAHVMKYLANDGLLDNGLKVRNMTMPDKFIEQDSPANQLDQAGLTARHIVSQVLCALGRDTEDPFIIETHRA